ncbi:MAG: hybrid sensor histidine kinase/response regulator [Gammaproteobacteria bacterium]|nr:hybrid sensor histidine kinase/response regulator [Gammaproteobacteria bacterium]
MAVSKASDTSHLCSDLYRSRPATDELVKILYYQPIYSILTGHALAVFITVVFLWNTVPLQWLLPWAVIIVTQTLVWAYLVAKFRKEQHQQDKIREAIRLFPIAGAVTGIFWGATLYSPNVIHDTTSMVFLSIMVLGITAAGLAVFAPYLRSYSAFAGCTLIPFAVRFFIEDTRLHLTLGIMFLLYLTIVLISGLNMKRAVTESIRLRLTNTDLVADLMIKNSLAERAREEAVQADISKSKFLAAASHDLRQPLHALGLFVDALESRIHYSEVRHIVNNIRISTDALSDLLNSLLDISKLDAGVLEPRLTDFPLRPILNRIATDYSEVASSKSLQLRIVDCKLMIHTDPGMLERILRNLVSNAIRYTHNGRVLLGCRRHQDPVNGDRICIEVHDTGIGISDENIGNIFEEFYQIENPERDRSKGLGLGLAIVKRLADLLNCPLTVRSSPEKGSVFRLSVPFVSNTVLLSEPALDYLEDLKDTRVLIIDDEALIRIGMCQVLEQWGCSVLQAESIEQALELLGEQCEIDMILTDYRLRDNQTGLDAINSIHAACNRNIAALILTGDTDPQRLREAKDSGFKLLHKPVSSAKLRSLMSYLLEQETKS